MPKFRIEDTADAYTYYVMIMGVDPELFWHADMAFIRKTVGNHAAYSHYVTQKREEMRTRGK